MIMKLLSIIKSEIIVVMVKLLMIVMTMAMKGLIIVTRMMIHQALGHTCFSGGPVLHQQSTKLKAYKAVNPLCGCMTWTP